MCLIALAGALFFAVVVPRRSALELDLAALPGGARRQPERAAA